MLSIAATPFDRRRSTGFGASSVRLSCASPARTPNGHAAFRDVRLACWFRPRHMLRPRWISRVSAHLPRRVPISTSSSTARGRRRYRFRRIADASAPSTRCAIKPARSSSRRSPMQSAPRSRSTRRASGLPRRSTRAESTSRDHAARARIGAAAAARDRRAARAFAASGGHRETCAPWHRRAAARLRNAGCERSAALPLDHRSGRTRPARSRRLRARRCASEGTAGGLRHLRRAARQSRPA